MDLSAFSENELIDLNHKIVKQLNFLRQTRTHKSMLKFNIGETVYFDHNDDKIIGIISKFNKKTVTIVTSKGPQWNVSPNLLNRMKPSNIRDVTPPKNTTSMKSSLMQPFLNARVRISRNALCPCGSGKKYKRCCAYKSGEF